MNYLIIIGLFQKINALSNYRPPHGSNVSCPGKFIFGIFMVLFEFWPISCPKPRLRSPYLGKVARSKGCDFRNFDKWK